MSDFKLTFDVNTTDASAELNVDVFIDSTKIYSGIIKTLEKIEHLISDSSESDHELRIVLSGKQPSHTKIDSNNNIVSDALIIISDIQFDGINCSQIATNVGIYTHDFNGNGVNTESKFYGAMGCNGTLSIKFSTPIYIWLLEHM